MIHRAAFLAAAVFALAAPDLLCVADALETALRADGQEPVPPKNHILAPPQETWQRAIGPWAWSFPRDHGAHPAFKTEWWYFTGNLRGAAGHRLGYQLTFFRTAFAATPATQAVRKKVS